MAEELVSKELIEIIGDSLRSEAAYIKRGLADCDRQLSFLRKQIDEVQSEAGRLGERAQSLSEQIERFERIAGTAVNS